MSYVDLNPIRAGIAASFEDSDFTSIQQQIAAKATEFASSAEVQPPARAEPAGSLPELIPFADAKPAANDEALPVELDDYIELLTAPGAVLRSGNPGASVPDAAGRILERLGTASQHWLKTIRCYHRRFFAMVGCVHVIDIYCGRTHRSRARGRRWAERAFRTAA